LNTFASIGQRSWLSLALLLIGCGLFASTLGTSYAELGGAFSPVFFPRIILAGWILLALLSLLADVISNERKSDDQWLPATVLSIALFAYIKLMPAVGFFIASLVFSVVVLVTTGQRRPVDVILFSIIVPGVLVGLFNHLLTMPLPVSPFFWWL